MRNQRNMKRDLAAAALFALLAIGSGAQAEDAFKCMEETPEKCDFENANMAAFIRGR